MLLLTAGIALLLLLWSIQPYLFWLVVIAGAIANLLGGVLGLFVTNVVGLPTDGSPWREYDDDESEVDPESGS